MSDGSVLQPARDLIGTGDWDGAAHWLQEVDRSTWTSEDQGRARALNLFATASDDEAILREIERDTRRQSHDLPWLLGFADEFWWYDETAMAAQVLEAAIRRHRTAWEPWFELSVMRFETGEIEEALAAADQAVALAPEDARVLRQRADCLDRLGRREEGVDAHRACVAAEPDDDENWVALGYALAELQDYDGADEAFLQAERLAPDSPGAVFERGRTAAADSRPERIPRMAAAARRLRELQPGGWRVAMLEGLLADAEGRPSEAWDTLRDACRKARAEHALDFAVPAVVRALLIAEQQPDLPGIEEFVDWLLRAEDGWERALQPAVLQALARLSGPAKVRARHWLVVVEGQAMHAAKPGEEPALRTFMSTLGVAADGPARARSLATAFEARRGAVNVRSLRCTRGDIIENVALGVDEIRVERIYFPLVTSSSDAPPSGPAEP